MIEQRSNRAGRYEQQPQGYSVFIPDTLPPIPSVQFDSSLQEALFSCRIEGIHCSFQDLLNVEVGIARKDSKNNAFEVLNCIAVLELGLKQSETVSIATPLIQDVHRVLLRDASLHLTPGELRTIQN